MKKNRYLNIDTIVLKTDEDDGIKYYATYSIEHDAKKMFYRGDALTKSDLDFNDSYYVEGKRAENIMYKLEHDFNYKIYYEPYEYNMYINGEELEDE